MARKSPWKQIICIFSGLFVLPLFHVQPLLVRRQVPLLTPSPHVQIDGVCSRACSVFPSSPSWFCSFPFELFLLCLGDSFSCQVLICICSFPRANTLICDFCYDTADFCSLSSFLFFFLNFILLSRRWFLCYGEAQCFRKNVRFPDS